MKSRLQWNAGYVSIISVDSEITSNQRVISMVQLYSFIVVCRRNGLFKQSWPRPWTVSLTQVERIEVYFYKYCSDFFYIHSITSDIHSSLCQIVIWIYISLICQTKYKLGKRISETGRFQKTFEIIIRKTVSVLTV